MSLPRSNSPDANSGLPSTQHTSTLYTIPPSSAPIRNPNRQFSFNGPIQTQGLPLPATSPRSPGTTSPNTPTSFRRDRAHTVSVALRKPRGNSISQGSTLGSARRSSLIRAEEESGSRRRSSSVREPVDFDLGSSDQGLHDEVVGLLDVIDPQVSTVNHLQNMSNGLVFPHLPSLWSRRPEVVLPDTPKDESTVPLTASEGGDNIPSTATTRGRSGSTRSRSGTVSRLFPPTPTTDKPFHSAAPTGTGKFQPIPETNDDEDIAQRELSDDVEEMEKSDELDSHVRHVLKNKSKRDTAKRVLKGVWTYIKTPMGFVVAIYGFLVVFWGAALVIFLAGWIPTSSADRKNFWVEICSQILNGLFTITGVGLIPWRVTDSFRMVVISRMKRKIVTRRKAQGLPPIEDPNDIPDPREHAEYVSVLTADEQRQLLLHQEKFAESQTWYKPHATATHTAFPISWALWNTLMMDGNSLFQCAMCGCMWGFNRHNRPAWTTGMFMPLSFVCGIIAGICIWQGSKRTKKTVKVEETLRQALDVHLAIGGIPQTKDGTIIVTETRGPPTDPQSARRDSRDSDSGTGTDEKDRSPDLPDFSTLHRETDATNEDQDKTRRATVSFGTVPEKVESRHRGATVAEPISVEQTGGMRVDDVEMREMRDKGVNK